jgi:branched-chain amino acid transport system permease protein
VSKPVRILALAAAAAFLFLPLVTQNPYYLHSVACKVCIYVILVAGLDLVVGYSGDVSVGHAGLYAAGAYTAAVLVTKAHWPFLPAALAAIVMGALFGLALGIPALRLSGPYLAVSTIAFGLIVQTVMNEAEGLTNGSQGIQNIPKLTFGKWNFEGNNLYYLVYPLMLVSLLGVHRVATSYWGRAFEALKSSSIAAECSGISRYRYKLSVFVLSAALAGLAGALFIHIDKYVGPTTFSLQLSILFLIALIFGGTRSLLGNVLGCLVVVVLPDVFNRFADYQLMTFGGLLLFTLYFLPGGLAGLLRRLVPAPSRTLSEKKAAADAGAAIQVRADGGAPGAEALLQTERLTIAFGGLIAVNGLDLSIGRGEVHALIGPNGSGKSTTVNLLTGVYRPTSGRVIFAGKPFVRARPFDVSRAGIARTFQNVALFGDMTVLENVLVGLHHTFHGGLAHVLLRTPRAVREERDARARARALVDFVGLGDLANERAKNLPYGKQRLLEIARALAQDPRLLLLDEPAAGLTAGEIAAVDGLIAKLKERGLAVLLIEHHMDLVMSVSDAITVLDFGEKIAEGSPREIQKNPQVIAAYLGTSAEGAPPETAGA